MRHSALLALFLSAALTGCGSSDGDTGNGGSAGSPVGPGGAGSGGTGGQGGSGGDGGSGAGGNVPCQPAVGDGQPGSDTWNDGGETATVTVDESDDCARGYTLSTTQVLVDALPDNPRAFAELPDQPVVRSGHRMFDALYALSLEEVRENSVDAISDWAFNDGNPIACPPGGCFETGRKWTYVWTRDTAYAVQLSLGLLDPVRAKNSLAFKLSQRRGGGDLQIVQDTGSGGSYPVSTDRVVWALGAWEVLKYLEGAERAAFRDDAYEAMKNTAEHDRVVVWDASDGLYTGEQSFLDWREQSYPGFSADDTVQIAMSKALSTNVGHLRLLEITASLATEKGASSEASTYQGWADQLRQAIVDRLWLPSEQQFSTFVPSTLDPAAVRRFDLLGSAQAILAGVGSSSQRSQAVSSYPHLPQGPPVMWPQQQFTPIYHNRGIWPFVTALWLKAAKDVGNADAVSHGVRSLMRGAAMNLSNMENFEASTGLPYKGDEGADSGPVVNSQRQLWSVAGYAAMVQDVVFGLEVSQTGLRFTPFVPRALRNDLFSGAERIALSRLPYKGGHVAVVLDLGPADGTSTGALVAETIRLNGTIVDTGFVDAASLNGDDVFEITLAPDSTTSAPITTLSQADLADYQNLFGPRTPVISSIAIDGGLLGLSLDLAGENPAEVSLDVYRDGALIAEGLPGSTSYWVDPNSGGQNTTSHCYSLEAQFASGNRSQHAMARCWWGAGFERITTVGAQSLSNVGGDYVFNYGQWHFQNWGGPTDSLTVTSFSPSNSGTHLIQLRAGNGGPVDTGVTCGLKLVEVLDGNTVVASGYAAMPHLGSWSQWKDSSFVRAELDAAKTYDIVIREDGHAVNMSERDHFTLYGSTGGVAGRFNMVNISEVKILALDAP
jgi:Mannosylglycerate hydrolase MGH1-like glycoside hydrolase domain